jgi:hypothetical protein
VGKRRREGSPQALGRKKKAWDGKQIETKTTLSKIEAGALGEHIVMSYLYSKGMKDARSVNVGRNNYPVDLVQDHGAIEVKTGLVSNGDTAMHWRATIGQPGKAEQAWLKTASKEAKRSWNEQKAQQILDRKQAALKEMSMALKRPVKGSTMTTIINPDTRTADLYRFNGFHLRIAWNSPQAKAGYVGTFRY